MPTDSQITDDQISAFTMDLATKVVAMASRVADAYVRKVDREAEGDSILPGECAASPQPPAGTPTGPANADGSFNKPVLRQMWTASTDPDADTTYRLVPVGD